MGFPEGGGLLVLVVLLVTLTNSVQVTGSVRIGDSSQDSAGVADRNYLIRYVMGDDRPRSDDGSTANPHSSQDDHVTTQPGTLAYLDGSGLAGTSLPLLIVQGMVGAEEPCAGAYPHIPAYGNRSVVQHDGSIIDQRLAANSYVATDFASEVRIDDDILLYLAQQVFQNPSAFLLLSGAGPVVCQKEVFRPFPLAIDVGMGVLVDLTGYHPFPFGPAGPAHSRRFIVSHAHHLPGLQDQSAAGDLGAQHLLA